MRSSSFLVPAAWRLLLERDRHSPAVSCHSYRRTKTEAIAIPPAGLSIDDCPERPLIMSSTTGDERRTIEVWSLVRIHHDPM